MKKKTLQKITTLLLGITLALLITNSTLLEKKIYYSPQQTETTTCNVGTIQECTTGKKGICERGIQLCKTDKTWGECIAQEKPSFEFCDGLDNNCNGETDEKCKKETNLCNNGKLDLGELETDCGGYCKACEKETPLQKFTDIFGLYILTGLFLLGITGILTFTVKEALETKKIQEIKTKLQKTN